MAEYIEDDGSSGLIDFASPVRAPQFSSARRLTLGAVAVARGTLRPNPGRRLGTVQLTVVLHEGAPFRMEWRTPGSDRIMSGFIVPGTTRFIAPDRSLWQRWQAMPRILAVAIDPSFAAAVAERAFDRAVAVAEILDLRPAIGAEDATIRQIGTLLGHELAGGGTGGRLYAESLGAALTAHIVQHYGIRELPSDSRRGGLGPSRLRRVLEYMDDNLAADLTLAELAHVAGVSPSHFGQAFKESVGRPPHRYLLERRVHRAKEMLADDRLPIAEIGLEVGFASQSHFTLNFRRLTGTTPARFRRAL